MQRGDKVAELDVQFIQRHANLRCMRAYTKTAAPMSRYLLHRFNRRGWHAARPNALFSAGIPYLLGSGAGESHSENHLVLPLYTCCQSRPAGMPSPVALGWRMLSLRQEACRLCYNHPRASNMWGEHAANRR